MCAWREEDAAGPLHLQVLFISFGDEIYLTGYCRFMETFFAALILVNNNYKVL